MSSLKKHQKQLILDFILSQSLDLVQTQEGGQSTYIVQNFSPNSKSLSKSRKFTQNRVMSNQCKKLVQERSPRTGLHRAISIGIITYKGGLSRDSYSMFRRSLEKHSMSGRSCCKVVEGSKREARSITSSPSIASPGIAVNKTKEESKTSPNNERGERDDENIKQSNSKRSREELNYPKFFSLFQVPRGTRPKRMSKRKK